MSICKRCGEEVDFCRCVREANDTAEMERVTAERDAWRRRCEESEQREVNLRLANDVLHGRLRVDWAKYAPAAQADIERLEAERQRLQSLCFTHVEARDAALKRIKELEEQLAAK